MAGTSLGTLWEDFGIVADVVVSVRYSLYFEHSLIYPQPFTNDFVRADIHELLAPDLLHQIIKGTFKDHLVTWVNNYIHAMHPKKKADEILDDIDRR